jgi:predicted nuclease of predicted toxin-antitoxin system
VKIKIDENLPATLAAWLASMGHDAQTVPGEGLAGHDDPSVWAASQREGRFLITQDLDFSDTRQFAPGSHHGILLLRLRIPGRLALTSRIQTLFRQENVEAWKRCFVVATDVKLRVKTPTHS